MSEIWLMKIECVVTMALIGSEGCFLKIIINGLTFPHTLCQERPRVSKGIFTLGSNT